MDPVPIDDNNTCVFEPNVETREAIEILLENSPPRQAAILVLVDVFEFTAKEVAGMLTITEGSVKAVLHRARANIRISTDSILRYHPKQTLIEQFVDAINQQNPSLIKKVLVELQDSGVPVKKVEKNEVSYFIIEDPDGNTFIVRSPKKFMNVSKTDK